MHELFGYIEVFDNPKCKHVRNSVLTPPISSCCSKCCPKVSMERDAIDASVPQIE